MKSLTDKQAHQLETGLKEVATFLSTPEPRNTTEQAQAQTVLHDLAEMVEGLESQDANEAGS